MNGLGCGGRNTIAAIVQTVPHLDPKGDREVEQLFQVQFYQIGWEVYWGMDSGYCVICEKRRTDICNILIQHALLCQTPNMCSVNI